MTEGEAEERKKEKVSTLTTNRKRRGSKFQSLKPGQFQREMAQYAQEDLQEKEDKEDEKEKENEQHKDQQNEKQQVEEDETRQAVSDQTNENTASQTSTEEAEKQLKLDEGEMDDKKKPKALKGTLRHPVELPASTTTTPSEDLDNGASDAAQTAEEDLCKNNENSDENSTSERKSLGKKFSTDPFTQEPIFPASPKPEILHSALDKKNPTPSNKLKVLLNKDESSDASSACPSPRFARIHANAQSRQALLQTLDTLISTLSDAYGVSKSQQNSLKASQERVNTASDVLDSLGAFTKWTSETNQATRAAIEKVTTLNKDNIGDSTENSNRGNSEINKEKSTSMLRKEMDRIVQENGALRQDVRNLADKVSKLNQQLNEENDAKQTLSAQLQVEREEKERLEKELQELKLNLSSETKTETSQQKTKKSLPLEAEGSGKEVMSNTVKENVEEQQEQGRSETQVEDDSSERRDREKEFKPGGFVAGGIHVLASLVAFFIRGNNANAEGSPRASSARMSSSSTTNSPRASPLAVLRRRANSSTARRPSSE